MRRGAERPGDFERGAGERGGARPPERRAVAKTKRGLAVALALAACSGDPGTVVFVTVKDRPAVRTAAQLEVRVENAGSSVTQRFPLDADFPRTLTVTPEGRAGSLTLVGTAFDADGLAVASGSADVTIRPGAQANVDLQLDPSDFVVNTVVVGTQKLVFRSDFTGRQLAVHASGAFLVVWENDCPLQRCDILGRLFEADTRPRVNMVTQTDDEFIVNQDLDWTTAPAVAAGTDGFLIAWVYRDDADMTYHIKATAIDERGTHGDVFDTAVTAGGPTELAPTVVARPGGGYVVAWERSRVAPATGSEIVARRLNEVGALEGPEFPVAVEPALDLRVPHGAGLPGGGFVLVWTESDGLGTQRIRGRVFSSTGAPVNSGDLFISPEAGGQAAQPHVAATDEGFVVGWQYYDTSGRLEVRRFDGSGDALDSALVLVDPATDIYSSPSLAVHPGGTIGAAWHDCNTEGDGMGCGVHLQVLAPDLTPTTATGTIVNTTLAGNQDGPTLCPTDDGFLSAWTDASGQEPDVDGTGIRARRLYPSLAE